MTVKELQAALEALVTANPTNVDLEVVTEGCGCCKYNSFAKVEILPHYGVNLRALNDRELYPEYYQEDES